MGMWENFILAEISMRFDKLKEMDRFETWLDTGNGKYALETFMSKKFDQCIPIEYLNLKEIYQEIAYHADDVCDDVYIALKERASDYCLDNG
ncbi:hypothetical protein A0256_20740 [Mucilaginibacter sp. PAMC 26640]|nr:hypothetical protein A0256_20740 [Mucilaginibacter sp. PAMC 26640]